MAENRSRLAAVGAFTAALLAAGTLSPPAQALAPPPDPVGAALVEGAGVVTMVPVRIHSHPTVAPDAVRCLSVAGTHSIPADATAVVVNVTTVRPAGAGYAVVFPDSRGDGTTPMPGTSTVNFEPGQDVSASTLVRLGPNGRLCYATRGALRTGVLLDVSGYVEEGSGVIVAAPQRLLDTRTPGGPGALQPRANRTVQVSGELGVPEGVETGDPDAAVAAILNVTVTGATAPGNLRIWPGGLPHPPEVSVVNYAPGVDKASTTVARLSDERVPGTGQGQNGQVVLYSDSDRPVHVVVDVLGWTVLGGSYVSTGPTRALDTREDAPEGEPVAPLEAGDVLTLGFDEDLVPAEATAVVLNVTAIGPSTVGNLRVYPSTGTPDPPNASSVNYIPGRDIPNLVVVGLSEDGLVDMYTDQLAGGTVHVAVDVLGYLTD